MEFTPQRWKYYLLLKSEFSAPVRRSPWPWKTDEKNAKKEPFSILPRTQARAVKNRGWGSRVSSFRQSHYGSKHSREFRQSERGVHAATEGRPVSPSILLWKSSLRTCLQGIKDTPGAHVSATHLQKSSPPNLNSWAPSKPVRLGFWSCWKTDFQRGSKMRRKGYQLLELSAAYNVFNPLQKIVKYMMLNMYIMYVISIYLCCIFNINEF